MSNTRNLFIMATLVIATTLTHAQDPNNAGNASSELSPAEIYKIAKKTRKEKGDSIANAFAQKHISGLNDQQMFIPDNIRIIYEFTSNTKDRGFAFFRDNQKQIQEANPMFDESLTRSFLSQVIFQTDMKPLQAALHGKPDWNAIKKRVNKYGKLGIEAYESNGRYIAYDMEIEPELKSGAGWEKISSLIKQQKPLSWHQYLTFSTVEYYSKSADRGSKENWSNFMKSARYYETNYTSHFNSGERNKVGWAVFEQSSDPSELHTAIQWVKKGVEEAPDDVAILDTYANLLYRAGRKTEALIWSEKAVKISLGSSELTENYEKMKANIPTWPADIALNFEKQGSFSSIMAKAKEQNKNVMLDFTASWCAPCQRMDKYVFRDKHVADFINKNFIIVKIQADKTPEDADYIKNWHEESGQLLAKYKIKGFPILVFLSPDETEQKRVIGARSTLELMEILKELVPKE